MTKNESWLWLFSMFIFGSVVVNGIFVECQLDRAEQRIRANKIVSEAAYEKQLEGDQRIIDLEWQAQECTTELTRLAEDLDACHYNIEQVHWALEVVSRVEGPRARAPSVVKKTRPK